MKIYLVMRETKWKTPCSYGDHCEYYETETEVISAHRNANDAAKMIETETSLKTDQDVCFYCEVVELE